MSKHRVQGCSTKPIHDDGKKSKLHIYPNLTTANDLLVVHTSNMDLDDCWSWLEGATDKETFYKHHLGLSKQFTSTTHVLMRVYPIGLQIFHPP